jgi:hypothetical protein
MLLDLCHNIQILCTVSRGKYLGTKAEHETFMIIGLTVVNVKFTFLQIVKFSIK